MRVDFYQLGDEPAEAVAPLLARQAKKAGERLLVVSDDAAQLERIDRALWERLPQAFLAHGHADQPHAPRQPVLLSASCEAANGTRLAMLADGRWREEAAGFDRVFLLFGDGRLAEARACWRLLGQREGVERRFWKLEGGRWREGP